MIPDDINNLGESLLKKHGLAGHVGGAQLFDEVGRDLFILMLENGLLPKSKVLDVGCGLFRVGYWLVRFLDPGCYFGTEVRPECVEIGRNEVLGPDLFKLKQPTIKINGDFDFSIFEQKFDFVIARSIWSHASKTNVQKSLDSFAACSQENGVFLVSFLPAASSLEDYAGEAWASEPIRHYYYWINNQAKKRGLQAQEIVPRGELATMVQARTRRHWLKIGRPHIFRAHRFAAFTT